MISDKDKAAMKELVNAVATNAVELPDDDAREEYRCERHQEAEWDWRDAGMMPDAAARHAATLEPLAREMITVFLRRGGSWAARSDHSDLKIEPEHTDEIIDIFYKASLLA